MPFKEKPATMRFPNMTVWYQQLRGAIYVATLLLAAFVASPQDFLRLINWYGAYCFSFHP